MTLAPKSNSPKGVAYFASAKDRMPLRSSNNISKDHLQGFYVWSFKLWGRPEGVIRVVPILDARYLT